MPDNRSICANCGDVYGEEWCMECSCEQKEGDKLMSEVQDNGVMRQFGTGATRNSDEGKNDYDGFLSYPVLEVFGNYMTSHRKQADGKLRDSDNWQKGIPITAYMKSMWRHFLDVWAIHRGYQRIDKLTGKEITLKEALCALLFNVMGYLHEILKSENKT